MRRRVQSDEIFLQITFKLGTDPRPIAQLLARRIAGYWLRPTIREDSGCRTGGSGAPIVGGIAIGSHRGRMEVISVPVQHRSQRGRVRRRPSEKYPKLRGASVSRRVARRADRRSVGSTSRMEHQSFLASGVSTSPIREALCRTSQVRTSLWAAANHRGMYLADRSSHLPVLADGRRSRPLRRHRNVRLDCGISHHLSDARCDPDRFGRPGRRRRSAPRCATPVSEIASIGITSEVIEKGTLVDKGSPAALAIFPRDHAWGATWMTETKEMVQSDGGSKLEPISLVDFADRLVAGVGRVLGLDSPLRREIPSGFLYDLTGTPANGLDASDSSLPATCSSCRLGKGPGGYPCVACGGTLEVNR